jgi:hypothetical protein
MKLIEALKKIKDLQRKADDLRSKISQFCADMETDTPVYKTPEEQTKQIAGWLQAHGDIIKEIESLRIGIQKTNLETNVAIEVVDGKRVTKSIAAWIHRRKDLAKADAAAWLALTHRGLLPRAYAEKQGGEVTKVYQVRKYYDQKERDQKVEEYASEPSRIDAALEIVNAVTDLCK